ncbi:glycoside hydrolase family 3 N-terminal domain-containing protein, partial [Verrucomicrobiota bacterium]
MKIIWSFLLIICVVSAEAVEVYEDPNANIEARVEDLLKRLSLEEKIRLLHGNVSKDKDARFDAAGVERLKIDQIRMLDGRQGVRTREAKTTALSCTLSLSCTWDEKAAFAFGELLANELLALDRHVLLGPMINLVRTPLGGRNFENMGEDPYLAGRIASAYIRGVQSKKVAACACLIVANDYEKLRHFTSADMDDRTLREAHLLPYEMAAREGNVWSMMAANSLLNGVHCSQNRKLLQEIMKDDVGYDGVMLTDWRAAYEAVAAALGGLDMTMGVCSYVFGDGDLLQAVKDGKVKESLIDDKVRRVIRLCIRSGVLDPGIRDKGEVNTEAHRAAARRLGAEGMVLLKNENDLLPLDAGKLKKIMVTGPASGIVYAGGGSGHVQSDVNITPIQGVRSVFEGKVDIIYFDWPVPPFRSKEPLKAVDFNKLTEQADTVDAILFFAAGGSFSEGNVLQDMELPGKQAEAIDRLAKVNKNVIVVVM